VLDLCLAQRLEHRWHVVREPAAEALLEPVPTADGVLGRASPGLDGPIRGRLLLVGVAERHPIAVRLQHRSKIGQALEAVADLRLPDLRDERRRVEGFVSEGEVLRTTAWGGEDPRILTGSCALDHTDLGSS
jgi:hypothetical protein